MIAEIGIIIHNIWGKVFFTIKNVTNTEIETRTQPKYIKYVKFQAEKTILKTKIKLGIITPWPLYVINWGNSQNDSSLNTIWAKVTQPHSSVIGMFTPNEWIK